ncbi:hypothetical protein DFH06DRAFT_1180836 [Mycena polygramma]|nr:hypothetical protein DFH06DRAFT_1180836 [Mycena polygramma]
MQPRVGNIGGQQLPSTFILPSLASVRADAVCCELFYNCRDMIQRPENYKNIVLTFPPGSPANNEPIPVHLQPALMFTAQLPNLFKFAFFVHDEDAPEDILGECIWALAQHIQVMEGCSENILRTTGHVEGNTNCKIELYIKLMHARKKIALYLFRADRAKEAIPYTKAMVDAECLRGDEIWLQNPMVFEVYGEALVLTRADDHEAVKTLRRAMLGVESLNWGKLNADGLPHLIRTRVFLSRALRNIGDDEAKTHETWLINWFRKNHWGMQDKDLRSLLLPPGPIFEGLGGETWLKNRKLSSKADQRLAEACKVCRAKPPLVTLMRCNGCQHTYYCSKECQRVDWKHHKVQCREKIADREDIERMGVADPEGAKRATDWSLWCNRNHYANGLGMTHALGLRRDPQRGRTHIVIKKVKYIPTATKLAHKFHTIACGVFRIKDVLRDVEALMGLKREEGQPFIDQILSGLDNEDDVPHITLAFDGHVCGYSRGAISINGLRAIPYEPQWRKRLNVGAPPGPLKLGSGAEDVEHIF